MIRNMVVPFADTLSGARSNRNLQELNMSFHHVSKSLLIPFAMLLVSMCQAVPQENDGPFHKGSVIPDFGNVATVESDVEIPSGTVLKVRFDVGRKARKNSINTTFDSVARFINLNVAAGIPAENLQVAVVVHGSAALDVTKQDFYGAKNEGSSNASEKAVETLLKHNVRFILCGQSAAYQEITKKDLLDGVKVAPSAMTMHALLALEGFSLNPF